MVDIRIQPAADSDDDLSNAIVIDDASLPLSNQDAAALGIVLGDEYRAWVQGTPTTFTVTDVPAQMAAPTATSVDETTISVTRAADPDDNGSAITGYKLRYSTDESTWTTVAMGSNPQQVSDLEESTEYFVQTLATNENGDGEWSNSDSVTTSVDSTAPVLTNPVDDADEDTAATGSVDTNEGNGTLFWVVTQSATTPSGSQIINGQDHTSAAADADGSQSVNSAGTQTLDPAPSGLSAETGYWIHFAHRDAASNTSDAVSGDGFTTAAGAAPPTAWDASITLAASVQVYINPYRSAGSAVAIQNFDRSVGAVDNEGMSISNVSSANGSASAIAADIWPAGGVTGFIEYTPPANGGDTLTYDVNQNGVSDEGTLTITTEADNGYSYSEVVVSTDFIDEDTSPALHSSDLTDFTVGIICRISDDDGTKTILSLLDAVDDELFQFLQVGANFRVNADSTNYSFNNGAMGTGDPEGLGVGHLFAVIVTFEDIGGSETRIRVKWKRPDSDWFDAVDTTTSLVTVPFNTLDAYTIFRRYNGARQWEGTFTYMIGWPAVLDVDNQTHLDAVMSPGGQPVDPADVDTILGSRMTGLNFASLSDLQAPDGSTF